MELEKEAEKYTARSLLIVYNSLTFIPAVSFFFAHFSEGLLSSLLLHLQLPVSPVYYSKRGIVAKEIGTTNQEHSDS